MHELAVADRHHARLPSGRVFSASMRDLLIGPRPPRSDASVQISETVLLLRRISRRHQYNDFVIRASFIRTHLGAKGLRSCLPSDPLLARRALSLGAYPVVAFFVYHHGLEHFLRSSAPRSRRRQDRDLLAPKSLCPRHSCRRTCKMRCARQARLRRLLRA